MRRSSSSGPVSAACRRRATSRAAATTSWWSNASRPGRARRRGRAAGFRIDTGPTVLTMPGLLGRRFAAAGADMDDHLRSARSTRRTGRAFPTERAARAARRRGHAERDRDVRGAGRGRRLPSVLAWLGRALRARDAALHRPQLRLRARPRPRRGRCSGSSASAASGARPTRRRFFDDPRLQRIFSFQSMYAGLSPFEALALYCDHHVHGHGRGRVLPRRRDPRGAAGSRRGREGGVDVPLGTRGRAHHPAVPTASVRDVRLADRRAVAADAVVCNADLPSRTGRCWLDAAARRPARPVLAVGACGSPGAGRPPGGAAHHNIHFGQSGTRRSTHCSVTARRMPDPSILVTTPTLTTTVARARRVGHACTRSSRSRTSTGRRLGGRAAAACATTSRSGRRARLPGRRLGSNGSSTRPSGGARARARHAVPLAHRFLQTGRSGPERRPRASPGLVLAGMGTVPGVGVPMVLLSGRLAAERVDESSGSRAATPMTTLEASYARCRQLNGATAPPTTASTFLLPRVKRHHVHALYGFCRTPTTSSTTSARPRSTSASGRWPSSATASSPTSTGATPTTRCSRRSCTPCGLRHQPRLLPPFPPVDDDGPHRRDVRDLRRPARLHGRLGRGDRRDDAADPRADVAGDAPARPGPRHRVPAHELPARRRRGPRPPAGVRAAGGPPAFRRRSVAAAVDARGGT